MAGFEGDTQGFFKRVWKVTEKIVWGNIGSSTIRIGGGKGDATEVEWQRILKLRL